MPFTFKLSQRLARMRCTALVLTAAALAACEIPVRATDPGSTVAQVVVSPRTVTVRTNQMVAFMAVGLTAAGDTVPLSVSWSVTSGSVIDTSSSGGRHYGHYKAGTDTGKVKVIARGNPGGSTDTAVVTVTPVPVSAVTIAPTSASVLLGQTAQLAATTVDSAGNVLTGRTVTWTSNNSSVATVNGSGLVGVSAAGSATITATSEGHSGTASISVSNVPVASVTVSPATASLTVGGTQQLIATPKDANGNALTGRAVTWTSSNSGVASVSGSGLVGASTAGAATVTATSEGQSGTGSISVSNPAVASVTVSPATASLTVGGTQQLTATAKDASGNPLTGRTITWTSSNSGVATVSGSGLVSASSTGSTVITATSEGQSGTATVTVTAAPAPVATVTLSPASATVAVGASQQFTATLRDASGNVLTGRTITWTSNNSGVATVSGSGLVGASSTGSTVITATSEGQSGTATVTVTPPAPAPVATVTLSPASATVAVGASQQFTATLRDASGNVLTGRAISWTSSALSVANVSTIGLVTALLAGTTTITATSEGQSGAATMTVTALPPPGTWPNEPSGLSVLTDYGFGAALPVTPADVSIPGGSGWNVIYNGAGYG
ncbi:MAG TPA: Ig-like domain-containing protein, partial [Gemmatimonadales bacterium]|nr:Ig-like domain-containing protein [Gemmatimonadales bacterium]